jgi:enamine deaminase RidA (YjgF/YER057c/UK114 family)
MSINEKLKEMNLTIPQTAKPIANYVGARKVGNMVYISGQLPLENGQLKYIGKVGKEISVEDASKAAELCAINILSQLSAILSSDLEQVESCVKLGIFVNAIPEFEDHSVVANGASNLIVNIFGDSALHSRASIGVGSLPKNVCVEVEGIFTVK